MKTIIIIALTLASIGCLAQSKKPEKKAEIVEFNPKPSRPSHAVTQGPFGFEAGMTKDDLIAKLGAKSISKIEGDVVAFNTAPAPHPDFSGYICMFSPRAGLVKVLASSKIIETSESGEQLKEKYSKFLIALKVKYGVTPTEADYLETGSMWEEPKYWMMSLLKKQRKLEAIWSTKELDSIARPLPAHLSSVMIDVDAVGLEKGFITISYEFDGFSVYSVERRMKQDSVF